jgi:exonuclease SbcC
MIIKKIKLNNIRSYKYKEIDFPNGTTLLTGNIGSGKSTILLSADFALFGITKETPGTALLRNGEKEGSVELQMALNNKDIIIKRNLKRTPTSVSQESGYIIEEGQKQELTAMELKQRIIELLNYPPELLTKTKSLVYNYTVYTPQEKMKEILLSSKEHRLEILRKVFGIDKYKRVRNKKKKSYQKENKKL